MANCTSNADGNISNSASWVLGNIPTRSDTVKFTHVLTVDANAAWGVIDQTSTGRLVGVNSSFQITIGTAGAQYIVRALPISN